jgi:hypothetical protein
MDVEVIADVAFPGKGIRTMRRLPMLDRGNHGSFSID